MRFEISVLSGTAASIAVLITSAATLALPRASQQATGTDSAGVRIVSITRQEIARLPVWRLEPTPVVIGQGRAGNEYLLDRPGLPWRTSTGNIVFINGAGEYGGTEYRMYRSDGTHLRTVGRLGQGPGEFNGISHLHLGAGDSIHVVDSRLVTRVMVFSPSGAFARAFDIARFGVAPFGPKWMAASKVVVGLTAPGTTLTSAQARIATDTMFVVVRDATGSRADTVTKISRGWSRRSPVGLVSVPFYGGPQLAASSRSFAIADGDMFRIRWYDSTGRLLRIIRSSDIRNVIPMDTIVSFESRMAQGSDRGRVAPDAYPRNGPVITALVLDRVDRLWIKLWTPGTPAAAEWIVAEQGRLVARVSSDPTLTFADAGADYLLGRVRDALDVVSVRVYNIRR